MGMGNACMERKAQGSLEYLLLLAGVLLVVVLAVIVIRTGVLEKARQIIDDNFRGYLGATNASNLTPTG